MWNQFIALAYILNPPVNNGETMSRDGHKTIKVPLVFFKFLVFNFLQRLEKQWCIFHSLLRSYQFSNKSGKFPNGYTLLS